MQIFKLKQKRLIKNLEIISYDTIIYLIDLYGKIEIISLQQQKISKMFFNTKVEI